MIKIQIDIKGRVRLLPAILKEGERDKLKDLLFKVFPDAEIEHLEDEFTDSEMGFGGSKSEKRKWTAEDHKYLLKHYMSMGDIEIGEHIRRSGMGVYMQKATIIPQFIEFCKKHDISLRDHNKAVDEFISQRRY